MDMRRATGIARSGAAVIAGAVLVGAQTPDEDRARGLRMLRDIKNELRSWYYDAAFRWKTGRAGRQPVAVGL